MIYLESFRLAGERAETDFLLNSRKLDMTCIDVNNAYPFKIFPFKYLERVNSSGHKIALSEAWILFLYTIYAQPKPDSPISRIADRSPLSLVTDLNT